MIKHRLELPERSLAIVVTLVTLAVALLAAPGCSNATSSGGKQESFVFSDNFSEKAMSLSWAYYGQNGYYHILADEEPSYIVLGTNSNLAESAIGYFMVETRGYIELRFKFLQFNDADAVIICESNGGWFGARRWGGDTYFIYADTQGAPVVTYDLAKADQSWHIFSIRYSDSGREIYLDGIQELSLETQDSFAFLYLGNSQISDSFGGAVAVDWVRVQIDALGSPNYAVVVLAIVLPVVFLIVVGFVLHRSAGKKE